MPLSGEAIRLMNYIDDVAVTLRRVLAFIPTLSVDERARIHEHLQHSKPNVEDVVKARSSGRGRPARLVDLVNGV